MKTEENNNINEIRAEYGLREFCDCCGNDRRIHNYGNEYEQPIIVLENTQFLCENCRE